jgi:hypothetical protein
MSVLSKIGAVLLNVGQVATSVMGLPFVSQLLGAGASSLAGKVSTAVTTGVGDLGTIAGLVSIAEAMFPATAGVKTGSQKLAAVSPLVGQAILIWAQSNLPGHNKIKTSPELFQQHVTAFTSSFVDILTDFGE